MVLEAEMTQLRMVAGDEDTVAIAQLAEVVGRLAEAAGDTAGVDVMRGIVVDMTHVRTEGKKRKKEAKEKWEKEKKEKKEKKDKD